MPAADLTPFVPRLVPEWIADAPDATYRRIDGTLVFTDLSGFTAMSERLAAMGKVGAEELTQHLDATFTELVSVSGGLGGTMLKFGGDALLILFWGEQHEVRAARAAIEMQEKLDRVGRITTSAGEFTLQMTVGAHCGAVDFFLVGASHRELFVCGEVATRTVEIEGLAAAGEIRLSTDLAGRLPRDLVDGRADPPRLVGSPSVDRGPAEWPRWQAGVTAERFVPEALRNHLASGIDLREHRQMSVAFVHLANLDELIADVGGEITSGHLEEFIAHAQSALAAHGVALVSTDVYEGGPKIICCAGAVRTYGNDDESLLRALREIVDHPSRIEVRVGVNRGHGFCGYVGPPFRRTFVTIGDVVNTAARVMAKAGSGEILSTIGSLERSETTFETEALEPFEAKGKAEPLQAFRVGRVSGSRSVSDRSQLPLIGRDGEFDRLTRLSADVIGGVGRFVEIIGETGIGKTRLVEELMSRSELRVVETRCGRYAGATPYFPFRALIGDLIGQDLDAIGERLVTDSPDLVPFVPLIALFLGQTAPHTPEIERLSAKEQRARLNDVVAALVRLVVREPTIWVVEDAHWIDQASADLLRYLAADAATLPLLVCVTRRLGEGAPFGSDEQVLEVAPLAEGRCHELLGAAANVHLLPRELRRLTERSHGNPYFLIELAEVVSGLRDLDQLPDSLEALVAAKIDALSAHDRLVLRQLAAVGGRFDPHIAEEAVPSLREVGDDRWARLDEFIDRSEVQWRFRQTLVRDTAYEGLSYKERRDVHDRAGVAIEHDASDTSLVCELLSLHFDAAGSHAKSLHYSNAAGEKANLAFAIAESGVFFRRSVEAARALARPEALGEALTSLAHAEFGQGFYAPAREHYDESLAIKRELGDQRGIAAQLTGLGLVARQLGEYDAARGLFEESLEMLRTLTDARGIGQVLRNIGTIAWLQGNYPDAHGWFEESLDVLTKEGDRTGMASALDTLGSVSFVMGDLKEAQSRYEQGVSILREEGNKQGLATALLNLGNVAFQGGRLKEAHGRYTESLEMRRDLGDRHGVSSALRNLGTVAYFDRDFEHSRRYYEESLGIAREMGDQNGVSQCLHNLGEIAIVTGDLADANDLCAEALRIRRDLGDPRGKAESLTTLGNITSDQGRPLEALAHLLEALDILHELKNMPGLAECLEAVAAIAHALGDNERAATLLGAVEAFLESTGSSRNWSPEKRAVLEASLEHVLGRDGLNRSLEVGRAMSIDQVTDLARGSPVEQA